MASATRYQLLGNVIFETVANETVIINLENGRYYSLNPTASGIWEELMRQANSDEIVVLLTAPENPAPAVMLTAIAQFVDELIAEELLTPAPANTPGPSFVASTPARIRFEPPKLEKFTDMEELIPLDPIHQVGTLGWPYRIQDNPDQSTE